MPPKRKSEGAQAPTKKGAAAAAAAAGPAERAAVGPPQDTWDAEKETTVVLFCGSNDWEVAAKKGPGSEIVGLHRIRGLAGHEFTKVAASPSGTSFAILTSEGVLFMFGRNDQGQLGLGDLLNRSHPVKVPIPGKVTQVALGRRHTVVLLADGTAMSFGDNRNGQLGLGHTRSPMPTASPIPAMSGLVKCACGGDFTMLLHGSGALYSCGHPEYGQLGDGSDGKYFVTASRLSHNWVLSPTQITNFLSKDGPVAGVEIEDVVCGTNHTIAIDRQRRVFTWGFGGYGRLGHAETKDEMFPRMLTFFSLPNCSALMAAAGGQCSLAVAASTQLMFWGQIKATGEATMYPKPEHDLAGWKIRKISAGNKHIAVLAEEDVVTWGPAPTCGELGYGEGVSKSSTKPKIVDALHGLDVADVACGYYNTLYVVKLTPETRARAAAFPVY